MPYDWSTALPGEPWSAELPGIFSRHDDGCPVQYGRRCTCGPLGYIATLVDPITNRPLVSPQFPAVADAQRWQRAQGAGLTASAEGAYGQTAPASAAYGQTRSAFGGYGGQPGGVTASQNVTRDRNDLGALIDEFVEAAQDGRSRDVDGEQFTRERLRELRRALSYVDSELGTVAVQDVRRRNVQALIDQMRASGVGADVVTSVPDALRLLYSYAIQRGLVDHTPVVELVLPDPGPAMSAPGSPLPPSSGSFPAYPTPPAAPGPATYVTPAAFPAQGGDPSAYPAPYGYSTPIGVPAPTGFPPAYDASTSQGMPAANGYGPGVAFGAPTPHGMPAANSYGTGNGLATRILGVPPQVSAAPNGEFEATQQERFLWWTVRIVVIVFVLIALVLAAESV
jgi:hypothetical protein